MVVAFSHFSLGQDFSINIFSFVGMYSLAVISNLLLTMFTYLDVVNGGDENIERFAY